MPTPGLIRSTREGGVAQHANHRLAGALVLAALGVLVVAISYDQGRAGVPGADVLVWAGRVLVWLALMFVALAPRVPDGHRLVALVAQAVAQSLMRWMYAPRGFRFPDELLHLRTALEVGDNATLAVHNPLLPISPAFPGLEAVTNALATVGHLSIFAAGTVVVSVAHVTLVVAVFGLVRLLGLGSRLAAAASLIFAVGPHHPAFDTMFIYLTPGLLLMVTALALALDARAPRRLTGGLSLACLAGVVVTHHVTAAVTLVVLVMGVGAALVSRERDHARRLACLAAAGATLAFAWTALKTADISTYVLGPINAAFGPAPPTTVRTRLHGAGVALGPGGLALGYASFATACALVGIGIRQLWQVRRANVRLAAVGACGFFAVLGVRIAGDGEIAARGLTYVLLFAAIPIAAVVVRVWATGARPWRAVVSALMVTLLFVGFSVVGWPPTWEAVPGKFHIAGFESGVDGANTAAAKWARSGIGSGHRVACDLGTCSLFGAYGRQDALSDASALFYAPSFGPQTDRLVRDIGIEFAAVDLRLGRQLPIQGEYFRADTGTAKDRPIPQLDLAKFDAAPQVGRIYDNGTVRLYDLRSEGRYGP